MPSIFANSDDQVWNGSFRADDLVMSFGAVDGAGALVQQAQWNIQRQVNMLYEIGSTNIYYVGNRRSGTVTLSRVVGPSDVYEQLLAAAGDMCDPKNLELTALGGCGPGAAGASRTWTMLTALLTRVGGSVTAQDIVINETLEFMFADLTINGGGGGGVPALPPGLVPP